MNPSLALLQPVAEQLQHQLVDWVVGNCLKQLLILEDSIKSGSSVAGLYYFAKRKACWKLYLVKWGLLFQSLAGNLVGF